MSLTFAEPLLLHTTACTERGCRLQHYSKVVAAYITQQTICTLTVSITGLPRAHSDRLVYLEPRYIIAKDAMSVFMLNVLNYITASRAVCKVYLRQEKESYIQKCNFTFSFLCLFIILPTERKISRDQVKIFLIKIIER